MPIGINKNLLKNISFFRVITLNWCPINSNLNCWLMLVSECWTNITVLRKLWIWTKILLMLISGTKLWLRCTIKGPIRLWKSAGMKLLKKLFCWKKVRFRKKLQLRNTCTHISIIFPLFDRNNLCWKLFLKSIRWLLLRVLMRRKKNLSMGIWCLNYAGFLPQRKALKFRRKISNWAIQ